MMLTMWTVWAAAPTDTANGEALKVTVYVSNSAQVPGIAMAQARQEADRIYRAARVTLEWVECASEVPESSRYPACRPEDSRQNWLTLRLVSRSKMGGLRLGPSTMGLAAVPPEGGFGTMAFVCTECAEEALAGRPYTHGTILGVLMAHEISHLLLGAAPHSSVGLMRSQWNREDLLRAAQGRMIFTRKEAQQIEAQVRDLARRPPR
jgi:hypothetical protein